MNNGRYMTDWDQAFTQANNEGAYAGHIRDTAQSAWQNVMGMRDGFGGGFDEALMDAEANKKLAHTQADDHDLHKGATADAGHIAHDVVSYCKGLFGKG